MACQLKNLDGIGRKKSRLSSMYEGGIEVLHSVKRRLVSIKSSLGGQHHRKVGSPASLKDERAAMKAGVMVRVKEKNEIQAMLDREGKYKRCTFINRMYEFCGQTYQIHKEVVYFYDEAKQRMCKCNNIVLLEDVLCSGRQKLYLDDCDRRCFYFWHKDWLQAIQ